MTTVDTSDPIHVRLIGRHSCRVYADFIAQPGTQWVVRFDQDDSIGLEDWTGRPMDTGPTLSVADPSGCAWET